MYTIKVQRIAALAPAEDLIPRCVVEAVACTEQRVAAEAVARECYAMATTLQVWIEFDQDLPN